MIAAGLGCRRGCAARELVAIVDRALARAHKRRGDIHALYAPSFKHAEPGLAEAAVQLARPLVLLELSVLQRQSARQPVRFFSAPMRCDSQVGGDRASRWHPDAPNL